MAPQNPPDLNPSQRKAVEAPHKPLLIVAGAGTGKTRTLTSRILYFISIGVPPEDILALTFTNKAAREMEERVMHNLGKTRGFSGGKGASKPTLSTFHSLGARILRAEARHLGRTSQFVIFDDHDSSQLVRKILKSMDLGKEKEGPAWFLDKIGRVKNGMTPLDGLSSSSYPPLRLAARVYREYEEALKNQNAFDFDDLLSKVVDLWRENPRILAKYRKRYPYVLVDEYQDINNTQYEFIRLLAGESNNLSVVGDDQQTIYSWRGSNFEIFLNFESDWPGSQVVVLDQNYRSSGNIIRGASALIAHNRKQKPKELWTKNPEGDPIRVWEVNGEDEEADKVAREIAASDRRSTAILYRTNAQSRPVETSLIERGIPYRVYGGLKFYERREIKDLVAGLRLALNPKDELSKDRLLKAFRKTKYAMLEEALAYSKEASPSELLLIIIKTLDYLEYVKKNFPNYEERRENIHELMFFASKFENVSDLLEQITLLQATDSIRNDEAAGLVVNLMTMHLAKGLEFDRVYIVGAVEGILPHARSLESESELEEERRLMYVAMTRARKNLTISFYDLPSRFLSEIPGELLSYESTVSETENRSFDSEDRYISWD